MGMCANSTGDEQLEKKKLLAQRWDTLPESVKTKTQLIGKTAVACGATHHVMERCNFSCTCCYLGAEANKTEPLSFEAVAEQLDELRKHLGVGGKVQITAGEVTLLPLKKLGRIVVYAISLGLDPMVMSHGQRFLDEPDYLIALVRDYGLAKVSIHVDTTQRGRRGHDSKMSEVDLHAVRDAFAVLIRRVRKETGRPFEAASTVTVTAGNVSEMNEVTDWFLRNCDAFRMLSFQPVADVGRTRKRQSEVQVDNSILWSQVEAACGRKMNDRPMHFGHQQCNITVPMVVANFSSRRIIFEGIRAGDLFDEDMFAAAVSEIGPAVDWTASGFMNALSLFTLYLRKPKFLWMTLRYSCYRFWSDRFKLEELFKLILSERRLPKIKPFLVVIHNFMSPGDLNTDLGKERLDACVFKLPVDGKLVSMCEMNATGLRAKIDRMQVEAKSMRGN